jgi:Flp pilus assembly protein TadD
MRGYRFALAAEVCVLGVACLAGCQHPDRLAPPASLLLAPDGSPSELGPRQVADVKVALGQTLEKRGQAAEAMAAYAEAVKADPSRADAWLRQAVLSDQQGQFKQSAELYHKALALRPGDPDIYCDMGYSLYLQQRWAEAEMNLRQALALRHDHRRARNNLGLVLAHTDRPEEAVAEFRKAGCSEADARANLAFALAMDGRWPEARQQYAGALASAPPSAALQKEVGKLDALVAWAGRARDRGASAGEAAPRAATTNGPPGASQQPLTQASWKPQEGGGAGSDSVRNTPAP